MDLGCGAVVEAVDSPNREGESPLFAAGLIDLIEEGDTLLADRAYCGYYNFFCLSQRGAFALMRLHATRDTGVLKGSDDAVVTWKKPRWRDAPSHLFREDWEKVPTRMQVRLVRVRINQPGFRPTEILLATTLMDATIEELAALYLRRWEIETSFGHIKTTLGMDHVHVKSPEMERKQMYLFFIAYNLVRWLMIRSGDRCSKLSFKGTLDCLQRWAAEMAHLGPRAFGRLFDEMLAVIAADKVPLRPNRTEPRRVKAGPKTYPRIMRHRSSYTLALQ